MSIVMTRFVLILGLLTAAWMATVDIRAANGLAGSNPADGATLDAVPERIELRFDGSIDPETVQIVVIAPNGARADTGTSRTAAESSRSVALRPGLADGRYLVYWLVAVPGSRATAFGDLTFSVEGTSPCQPASEATPRPPAEGCLPDPPAGSPGEPVSINDLFVTVSASGDQAGPVDLRASVTGRAGDPVEDAVVWFRARHLDMDHGELPYLAARVDPGVYQAESVGMGMGGQWRIAVDVVLPGELPVTIFVERTMVE